MRNVISRAGRTMGHSRYAPYVAAAARAAAPQIRRYVRNKAASVIQAGWRAYSTGSNRGTPTGSVPGPVRSGRRKPAGGRIISGNDQPLGINSTTTTVVLKKSSRKLIQKGAGKWFYVTNYSGFTTSVQGQQGLNELFYLSTNSQHTVATGNGYGVQNTYHALKDMNPNLNKTGSAIWTGGTVPWSNSKYVLMSADVNLDLSNMSNGNVMFDVMVYRVVKNHGNSLTTSTTAAFLTQGNNQAAIVAPTVLATDTAGSLSINIVGTQMSDCKNLKSNWKLVSKRYVNLAGAASENMTYKIKFNQLIDTAKIAAMGDLFQSNLSTLVFAVIQRGSVGTDTINIGNATYAQTRLAWVANVKYRLTAVRAGQDQINTGFAASQVTNNVVNIASQAITGTTPILV